MAVGGTKDLEPGRVCAIRLRPCRRGAVCRRGSEMGSLGGRGIGNAGSEMKIIVAYRGESPRPVVIEKAECVVGRKNPYKPPDLDLSPDDKVSRRHARLWVEGGACWVEDLGSRHGTLVNGVKINYALQLKTLDSVQVGETLLMVEEV